MHCECIVHEATINAMVAGIFNEWICNSAVYNALEEDLEIHYLLECLWNYNE